MNLFLTEISRSLSENAHAVIIMDRAPWHKSVTVSDNITILYLPPYSPELNPVEQVWDYLRSNYLSNRVYETINDVFDACCDAGNMFVAQPEVIFSIGMRSWIN
ncbi:transposase [Candidatus Dependentiae bacterium]|nr:transposase [Candidatus Dependentiae bacterium]